MKEIILTKRKNGMLVLLGTIVLYLLAIAGIICGGLLLDDGRSPVLFIASLVVFCLAWIPFLGLKVLKPQEALVLTLFGKYVGTLKGDGFYFVNPFCTAVNPAAKTKLNQSGDVTSVSLPVSANNGNASVELVNKKISLKIMTTTVLSMMLSSKALEK